MKSFFKKILVWKLTLIARLILARYKPRIIAITGNVGKTSTKDAIYVALKHTGGVRKSEKSFNSEFGVPLSIIGAQSGWNNPLSWAGIVLHGLWQIINPVFKYPKTLVLEVGADRPGDIKSIAKWLKPHVVVITRLPEVPVHIEFFPTVEAVAREKFALVDHLRKEGTFVWNADDERIREKKEETKVRTLSYGFADDAAIRASDVKILDEGITFKINFDGKSFPVLLKDIYAESFISVALAAIAAARAFGANMVDTIAGIQEYVPPKGRARFLKGVHNTIVIDDTYNSSPAALEAGLHMLKSLPFGKRKIAVIGDMLELGKYTNEAHREMGKLVKKSADLLITVGLRAKEVAVGAKSSRMAAKRIIQVEDALAANEVIDTLIEEGDVVFVKGSQGMRMERIVKHIMAEPERAGELLVRQGAQWKKR